jgi:hypothetical protein
MADSSRELVGPDVTAAVSFESYPRFIKGGFQDYEGLGIKRSTADSKHVPSARSRLLGNNFEAAPDQAIWRIRKPTACNARAMGACFAAPKKNYPVAGDGFCPFL